MKKNSLLKTLLIIFGVFVLLTWVIPSGSYNTNYVDKGLDPIGIFDLFKYPLYSFAIFVQYGMVILTIGIFYGILSKIGAYCKLCENIVKKIKHKKLFLGIITLVLILISSLLGNTLTLFLIIPFTYNLIVLLGYNKKTAFASTIGAILVGNICSIAGTNIAITNLEVFNLAITKEILTKIILFIMISFLYVNYVLSHSKLEKEDTILHGKSSSKQSLLPISVLLVITFIVTIIGVYSFDKLGFNLFKDLHQSLMNFEVNNFYVFKNLFKGILGFGSWDNYSLMVFILVMSIVISWVYGLKFKDMLDGVKKGLSKTYKPAIYATISGLILVVILNTNSNIVETINHSILGQDFSIIKTSTSAIISSIFYNDYVWLIGSGFGETLRLYDVNIYVVITTLVSGIHSLIMMLLPTSVVLTSGLVFTEYDYKDWLKYIWKFILIVFFVVLIVSVILMKFL